MAKIRHMAIFSDDPERLAQFYCNVFGMTVTQRTVTPRGGSSTWITDGYLDLAIIHPEAKDAKRGINHFGFSLEADERPGVLQRLEEHGIEPFKPPADRPYVEDAVHDPDGNKFDMSVAGLRERNPNRERAERLAAAAKS